MTYMLKRMLPLMVFSICLAGAAFAQTAGNSDDSELSPAEVLEAKELAGNFTARFVETKDLTPLVSEFYFGDFIDRYRKAGQQDDDSEGMNVFVSGLMIEPGILAEGSSEEWTRFYAAAHNFVLVPVLAAIKYSKDNPGSKTGFDVKGFYSSDVAALLDRNPNLSNMIEKKGDYKPISSSEEMRKATADLEKALELIRAKRSKELDLKIDKKELSRAFENEFFSPEPDISVEEEYGFPARTRFIQMRTPIFVQLILARDKDKLKVVYATLAFD